MPAIGGVVVPGCVGKKGIIPCRRVKDADGVAPERVRTVGGVFEAGSVGKEGLKTHRRISRAGSKTEERIIAFGGVIARIASVRRWVNQS